MLDAEYPPIFSVRTFPVSPSVIKRHRLTLSKRCICRLLPIVNDTGDVILKRAGIVRTSTGQFVGAFRIASYSGKVNSVEDMGFKDWGE